MVCSVLLCGEGTFCVGADGEALMTLLLLEQPQRAVVATTVAIKR
jgi:hypothetical protein